jgi:hypothetical protein
MSVQASAKGARSALLLRSSLVENNHEVGVFIEASDATVETSAVRVTALNGGGRFGSGVHLQPHPTSSLPSSVLLERTLVEQSSEGGVYVISSLIVLHACVVRDTVTNALGTNGDGVAVWSHEASASATITATRIERSQRGGVAAWGAEVSLGSSALTCHAFDIDYETYAGTASSLADLGGNACGCPEANAACTAVTSNLEPPPSLDSAAE